MSDGCKVKKHPFLRGFKKFNVVFHINKTSHCRVAFIRVRLHAEYRLFGSRITSLGIAHQLITGYNIPCLCYFVICEPTIILKNIYLRLPQEQLMGT